MIGQSDYKTNNHNIKQNNISRKLNFRVMHKSSLVTFRDALNVIENAMCFDKRSLMQSSSCGSLFSLHSRLNIIILISETHYDLYLVLLYLSISHALTLNVIAMFINFIIINISLALDDLWIHNSYDQSIWNSEKFITCYSLLASVIL